MEEEHILSVKYIYIYKSAVCPIMVPSVGTVESSGNIMKAAHPDRSEILGRIGEERVLSGIYGLV